MGPVSREGCISGYYCIEYDTIAVSSTFLRARRAFDDLHVRYSIQCGILISTASSFHLELLHSFSVAIEISSKKVSQNPSQTKGSPKH